MSKLIPFLVAGLFSSTVFAFDLPSIPSLTKKDTSFKAVPSPDAKKDTLADVSQAKKDSGAPSMQPALPSTGNPVSTSSGLATDPNAVANATTPQTATGANPFTGKSKAFEEKQKELELAKLETLLTEERLKQAAAGEELKYLSIKKRDEVVRTLNKSGSGKTVELPPPIPLDGMDDFTSEPSTSKSSKSSAKSSSSKKGSKSSKKGGKGSDLNTAQTDTLPAASSLPVAPPPPSVDVVGIVDLGGSKMALLKANNATQSAKIGDSTPIGKIEAISEKEVKIGGKSFALKKQGSVKISNPAYVPPPTLQNGQPVFQAPSAQATPPSVTEQASGSNLSSDAVPAPFVTSLDSASPSYNTAGTLSGGVKLPPLNLK